MGSILKMNSEELKIFLGVNEMKNYEVVFKQLSAEFLGTFLYLSLCLLVSEEFPNTVTTAFANGLLIACIVQAMGHVSGGHINPAVTAGMLVCGYIKPLKAICFIVVQMIGAIAGAGVAYVTSVSLRRTLGATIPGEGMRWDQTFLIELIATFILVLVAIGVTDPKRGAKGLGSAALAIGLSCTACQCASLPNTGSLNPIRSLGPAVVMNIWIQHWIYWVAPMLGGLLAGVVYGYVLNVTNYE